ncbi:saxiphilin-like [Paramacrobiotus metropolitanus]|uniref:saxiphilin-like n=1 Tax=Paramacrobiotus metropolitanus TaxID=2943436 RepID=UPI0024461517|nr:saxiphilin-like [Paramacrobiotus metropolitanus]
MNGAVVLIACALVGLCAAAEVPPRPVVGRDCRAHQLQVDESHLLGAWRPHCDADGSYSALQSHGSTGMSFCVDKLGTTIFPPRRGLKACACPRERNDKLQNMMIGSFIPQCDQDGTYAAQQVWGSTGMTRCVREDGTTILEGRQVRACKCPRAADAAPQMPGAFRPQCEADGTFRPRQSHGSTGYSWCVNQEGVAITAQVPPAQAATLNC